LKSLVCWPKQRAPEPIERVTCKRKAPDAALFIGSGKADEIAGQCGGATEIFFDYG
jgi:GTP-binding protein HflX